MDINAKKDNTNRTNDIRLPRVPVYQEAEHGDPENDVILSQVWTVDEQSKDVEKTGSEGSSGGDKTPEHGHSKQQSFPS